MKKNIKKYNDFILEESKSLSGTEKLTDEYLKYKLSKIGDFQLDINSLDTISNEVVKVILDFLLLRGNFYNTILNMVDFFPGYFSDMCKKEYANPENDFQEMQKMMGKKGFTINTIKNLFSERVNNLCAYDFSEFCFKNKGDRKIELLIRKIQMYTKMFKPEGLDQSTIDLIKVHKSGKIVSENGHCDVYLWNIAKILGYDPDEIVELGGDGWCYHGRDAEEIVIRYRYGYHHTQYGKMMLNQMNLSEDRFVEIALISLQNEILNSWKSDLRYHEGREGRSELSYALDNINFKDFSVVDDDRLVIYITELLNKISEEGAKLTLDDLKSVIAKHLEGYNLDIIFTGNELVIYSKKGE